LLNTRHEIARSIAAELLPAEKDVDTAILRNARLTTLVIEGRQKAKVGLTTGQDALDLVAQANAKLVEARGLLAQAHVAFRAVQSEVGLDAFAYGDIAECPPPTVARLSVVPAQRVA